MNDYDTFFVVISVIMVLIVIIMAILIFRRDYMPHLHLKIFGFRDYRVYFWYAETEGYGFKSAEQIETVKYLTDKIAFHILSKHLTGYYWTRGDVQAILSEFYSNLHFVYAQYKEKEGGKSTQKSYDIVLSSIESENLELIKKLRAINAEIVDFINALDEAEERRRQNGMVDVYDEAYRSGFDDEVEDEDTASVFEKKLE